MAIRNKFAVYIDGINYTSRAVMPLKWGDFLDEQLDECHLALRKCKKASFLPLTPVEIHLSNQLYYGSEENATVVSEETLVKQYLIADDAAKEGLVGKGFYDHDIALIELTKYLECIVVDTITFTNDIGRVYTDNQKDAFVPYDEGDESYRKGEFTGNLIIGEYPEIKSKYLTPEKVGDYTFSPVRQFFRDIRDNSSFSFEGSMASIEYKILIYEGAEISANLIFENHVVVHGSTTENEDLSFTTNLESGKQYTVIYKQYNPDLLNAEQNPNFMFKYRFIAVENKNSLKKWTATTAINRILDIVEPLRKGENPRFKLNDEQSGLFDSVLMPQLSITKCTLREALKEIGKIVHGEPRITAKKDEDGKYYYEVSYDMYGQMKYSRIASRKCLLDTVSHKVDNYATHLDSQAENLVNSMDVDAGSIVDPFEGGYKTVRTEQQYIRITEANMVISTQYPIYTVEKLECLTPYGDEVDITPYVFEKSVYNSRLSSYSMRYPYSKAYAIVYTQGAKNITALNFKSDADKPIFHAFANYAIVNILRDALGKSGFEIKSKFPSGDTDYPKLAFRVTYTPIYNARIEQTKPNYKEYPRAAAQIFNQMANIVEAKYYGENMKGAIARLGNAERSRTYRLAKLSDIPKAGELYDDNYYISTVMVEYLPTYFMCTIGLSRDFNRLSQHIGIPSERRFSEISQTQASERNVLYREFLVIGDAMSGDSGMILKSSFTNTLINGIVINHSTIGGRLSYVVAYGASRQGNTLNCVQIPVVSSSFGNAISFSWTYKDNYSAGDTAEYGQYTEEISGYFQNDYCYTDYYGRIYYYNFYLKEEGESKLFDDSKENYEDDLPKYDINALNENGAAYTSTPFVLRKDNREALQVNYQVDFVTNREGMIIGSALASTCSLITGRKTSLGARLYVFKEPLNKFVDRVTGRINVALNPDEGIPLLREPILQVIKASMAFKTDGKAWAIVTEQSNEDETVEDEQGNITTQKKLSGGEVLLAQNIEVKKGEYLAPIYFTPKRKIFDDTVWKDRK